MDRIERIKEEERKERDRNREEYNKREFAQLKPVTSGILEKMDAKRLLAYYNRFRKDVHRGDYDRSERYINNNPLLDQHIKEVKDLLATKPHVERSGKPKKEKKNKGK